MIMQKISKQDLHENIVADIHIGYSYIHVVGIYIEILLCSCSGESFHPFI